MFDFKALEFQTLWSQLKFMNLIYKEEEATGVLSKSVELSLADWRAVLLQGPS